MADSVYKVIELVGTSTESWEKAARTAVERASQSLRDLRIAEVAQLDMQISKGKVEAFTVIYRGNGEIEHGVTMLRTEDDRRTLGRIPARDTKTLCATMAQHPTTITMLMMATRARTFLAAAA